MNFEAISSQENNFKNKIEKHHESDREKLFKETTVYISAGGRGTRMESVIEKGEHGVTKALVEFDGKPMVQQHVDLLFELGFGNVIVGAGDHLNVKKYFADQERKNDRLHIVNAMEQEDTGGDLIKAVRESQDIGKNVIVENVDTLLYADLEKFIAQHESSGAVATIILTTKKRGTK